MATSNMGPTPATPLQAEALAAIASIFEKPDAKAEARDEVVPEEGAPSVPPSSDADAQGDHFEALLRR